MFTNLAWTPNTVQNWKVNTSVILNSSAVVPTTEKCWWRNHWIFQVPCGGWRWPSRGSWGWYLLLLCRISFPHRFSSWFILGNDSLPSPWITLTEDFSLHSLKSITQLWEDVGTCLTRLEIVAAVLSPDGITTHLLWACRLGKVITLSWGKNFWRKVGGSNGPLLLPLEAGTRQSER